MGAVSQEAKDNRLTPSRLCDQDEINKAQEQENEIIRIVRSHIREARLMKLTGTLTFEFAFLQGGLGRQKEATLRIKY